MGSRCETQTTCATENLCSTEYPCEQIGAGGYVCQGQFADWPMPDAQPGASVAPSYDTSTPGAVLDNVTGLMWQRQLPASYPGCTGAYGVYPPLEDTGDACVWSEAVDYCDALVLGPYSDWRLPTKIELESILDDTKSGPAIDRVAFPNAPGGEHWTGPMVYRPNTYVAAFVDFDSGRSAEQPLHLGLRVRCVRTASRQAWSDTPAQRFEVDKGANTAKDRQTGLTWRRLMEPGMFSWSDARARCDGGYRLPTHKELLTLSDPTWNYYNTRVLRGESEELESPEEAFWSASPYVGEPPAGVAGPSAWAVSVFFGSAQSDSVNASYRVRCVR